MASSQKLQRFKEAMRLVYGNFDSPPSPFLRGITSSLSASSSVSSLPGMSAASQPAPSATTPRSSTLTPPATPLPPWAETWNPPSFPGAGGHGGRYLWTDAFGLLNFITLYYCEWRNPIYLTLAKRLVHRVHEVLGRERDAPSSDERTGAEATLPARLPGATDAEPLAGGLRIGKVDDSGPDGDGQYHHYITIWAYALTQLSVASGEKAWVLLAAQLMSAVHRHFLIMDANQTGGGNESLPRLAWKLSTDLKRVLVPSSGHLDAVTGLAVTREIRRVTAYLTGEKEGECSLLDQEEKDYADLVERQIMGTSGHFLRPLPDPLDLGMGLWVITLPGLRREPWTRKYAEESLELAERLLDGQRNPARSRKRLAFREFGAVLGLKCYVGEDHDQNGRGRSRQHPLLQKCDTMVKFWEDFIRQSEDEEFEPISLVMYASALIPGAFQHGYPDTGAETDMG